MNQNGRLLFGTIAVIASVLLSGCTSTGATPSTSTERASATSTGADAPKTNAEKRLKAIADCLKEAGFDVTLTDESISYAVSEEQTSVYLAKKDECSASAGFDDTVPVTEELLKVNWEREKTSWACLTAKGYEIETVPSFSVYKERRLAANDYSSWASVPPDPGAKRDKLRKACPDPLERFFELN